MAAKCPKMAKRFGRCGSNHPRIHRRTLRCEVLEDRWMLSSPPPEVSDWNGTIPGGKIELGQMIPLPRTYYAGGSYNEPDVTFTITMNENRLFGPEHVVYTETVPSGMSKRYYDAAPGVFVDYGTPAGITDTVVLTVTTNVSGVIAQCSQELTVVLPEEMQDLIQIPVRWGVVEGSPEATVDGIEHKAGERVPGAEFIKILEGVNAIWVPQAHIAFRSAPADGIPVVADPQYTPGSYNELGDLDAARSAFGMCLEAQDAELEVEKAWQDMAPSQKGIVAVMARHLDYGETKGVATPLDKSVISRLNKHPRVDLKVSDVSGGYVLVQSAQFSYADYSKMLAHELGHTFLLGHGDGLDNNGDGLQPPTPGPRLFDFTDPLGLAQTDSLYVPPVEDQGTTAHSLMDYSSDTTLTALQIEQAREVAKLIPGAVFDAAKDPQGVLVSSSTWAPSPSGIPGDIAIAKAEVAETPGLQSTSFSHTLWGPLPPEARNDYLFFADLDNNPLTGAAPAALGFSTSFQGAELVTRVAVEGGVATPTVWQYLGGTLQQVSNPGITAVAYTPFDAELNKSLFGVVSVDVPNSVRGPMGQLIRIEAMAQQKTPDGQISRLPGPGDGSGVISLAAPTYPQATLSLPVVSPGAVTTVRASGLSPNKVAEIYMGGQLLATGSIDGNGNAAVPVSIPGNFSWGLQTVTVLVKGTAINAVTTVLIFNGSPVVYAGCDAVIDEYNRFTRTASFLDLQDDTWTATVDYGDGGGVEALALNPDKTFVLSHFYGDDGDHQVTVVVKDNHGGVGTGTFWVRVQNADPRVLVDLAAQSTQYSDSIDAVTFTATDAPTDTMNAEVFWSMDGSTFFPGLPDAASLEPGIGLQFSGDTDAVGSGTWTLCGIADLAPGTYTIRVVANDEDGGAGFADTTIVVNPEDARAAYVGPLFVSTDPGNPDHATIELRAVIRDITAVAPLSDPKAGNITTATVRFVNRDGSTIASGVPVSLIDSDMTTGVAVYQWDVPPLAVNQTAVSYTIGIIVEGFYTRDSSYDDTIVTVTRPNGDFITGGGYLINESSFGTYPGGDDLQTNFGFNIKFNKKLTNLQGHFNAIVRQEDGTVLQIKSNRAYSLAVDPTAGADGAATFVAKASLTDVTTPYSPVGIAGNLTLIVSVTDNGEPGTWDKLGFTLWDGSELLISSNWDGSRTIEQLLGDGNLAVHTARVAARDALFALLWEASFQESSQSKRDPQILDMSI